MSSENGDSNGSNPPGGSRTVLSAMDKEAEKVIRQLKNAFTEENFKPDETARKAFAKMETAEEQMKAVEDSKKVMQLLVNYDQKITQSSDTEKDWRTGYVQTMKALSEMVPDKDMLEKKTEDG